MAGDVYKIENLLTGKVYVGSSIHGYRKRFERHIRDLKANRHHSLYLQRAWDKYGEENFSIVLLESVEGTKKELIVREQYYLDLYKASSRSSGYNICPLASSPQGREISDETRKKLSLAKKRRLVSEETKIKQSKLKVKLSEEAVWTFMYAHHIEKESIRSIAKRTGHSRQSISDVVNGKYRYTMELKKKFHITYEV